jgi:hypothetical protein
MAAPIMTSKEREIYSSETATDGFYVVKATMCLFSTARTSRPAAG